MSASVLFEHPLNERIRLFLRIERMFKRINHHIQKPSYWDQQTAIQLILELSELTNRGDIKTDTMKELERHHNELQPLLEEQSVDRKKLSELLQRQQALLSEVYDSDGKLTDNIRADEMLSVIGQRTSIAGGGCTFDMPAYHLWLHLPGDERKSHLTHWLSPYNSLQKSIALCLEVLRLSSKEETLTASDGFYDSVLDTQQPLQLLRLRVPTEYAAYPEISAGKHRLNIRFLKLVSTRERPKQITGDVQFKLSMCSL